MYLFFRQKAKEKVQKEVAEMRLIYAASERCADLWYESGFSAPDAFLWVETPAEKAIVVSALEYGRASKQARKDVKVLMQEGLFRSCPLNYEQSLDTILYEYST